ncbi:MAG: substrate-binding domain-containing protein [Butyricicoccaceae bacterium]
MIKKLTSILICCTLMLCGCGGLKMERDRPDETIGVVLKAMDSQIWMEVRSGMEQAAAETGVELKLLYPESEREEEEQEDLIRDLLQHGVDALVVAPCNSNNTNWFVDQAQADGIRVLTVDTRALDCDLPYIGSDNRAIGKMAADYFSEHLPEDAEVSIIAGSEHQSTHIDRISGFKSGMTANGRTGEFRIIYGENTLQQGTYAAKELSFGHIESSGLFCTSAVLGLGAAVQLRDQKDVVILAVDTQDDAIQAVQDGSIDALITQSGYEIGYQSILTAVEWLRSGKEPEDILLPGMLLTKDNVEEFLETYHTEG